MIIKTLVNLTVRYPILRYKTNEENEISVPITDQIFKKPLIFANKIKDNIYIAV